MVIQSKSNEESGRRKQGAADPSGNAYKFMLWAGDGSPDTFRIRIWWEDAAGEHDVYDNDVDQPIGAGNIVVHTGNRVHALPGGQISSVRSNRAANKIGSLFVGGSSYVHS